MKRTFLRNDLKSLDVDMTSEELAEAAVSMGKMTGEIGELEDEVKTVRQTYKSSIETLENRRKTLAYDCRRGKTVKELDVVTEVDRDTGRIWYVIKSSGKEVEGPMASDDDLQEILPFQKSPASAAADDAS